MIKSEIKAKILSSLNPNIIKNSIFFDYDVGGQTWFGVGGKADVLFVPRNYIELKKFLSILPTGIEIHLIGLCSNLLIRDGGLEGVTIKLGKGFRNIEINNDLIKVGAGVPDKYLSRFCLENSLGGFEFFYGIPGNIGGAVSMNAGCYGGEISDIFVSAKCMDYFGNETELKKYEHLFSYRNINLLKNNIFTEITFHAKKGNEIEIKNRMEYINQSRISSQPQKVRTGGSTFKNPDSSVTNKKAWELINEVNHQSHNDIKLSDKHCNFIINKQKKSANMIEDFGENIRSKVFSKTGILLEWEIKIIGKVK